MDARLIKRKKSDYDLHDGNQQNKKQHGILSFTFPEGILFEILSHLPGSSLSRFRFVCKSWLALINTYPPLAKLHLSRGFKSSNCPSIIIQTWDNITLIDVALGCKKIVRMTSPNIWHHHEYISTSCNGLICVYGHRDFLLINPTTREQIVLPSPTQSVERFLPCFLGYIPTTQQYKVLRFFRRNSFCQYECEVLTVGTCSWRQIMFLNFDRPKFTKGVVVNGSIYCIVRIIDNQIYSGLEIMSFDLREEKFEPVQFHTSLSESDTLSELEGNLCVSLLKEPRSMEIWMLEDITNHVWIQKCILDMSSISLEFWTFKPILIHQGKILVKSFKDLCYYDLEKGVNVGNIYYGDMSDVQVHNESFVSLEALRCTG